MRSCSIWTTEERTNLYLQFFGLNEAPFSITPDPAFVYLSAAHREALAHLLYGVGQGGAGGFVQLTGEVGTGKTTICRCLLEQVPGDTRVALVLNSLVTPRELLATICEELGLDTRGLTESNKLMVDALNAYLLEQHALGRRVVVVIDEAQNLSPEALEQVRLLTNLETTKDKLLQMVLLGQPELRQLLQRQDLRQLSQRITARYHLSPLNQEETLAYVKHRLHVAGAHRNPFRRSAMRTLYQRSGGVPRLINIIADRSLAGAYARESESVTPAFVNSAANEVQPSESRVRSSRWPAAIATASVAVLAVISLITWGFPALERFRPVETAGTVKAVQEELKPTPAVMGSETPLLAKSQSPAVESSPLAAQPGAGTRDSMEAGDVNLPVGADTPGGTTTPLQQIEPGWLDSQHRLAWRTMAGLWQDGEGANAIAASCDGVNGLGYACFHDQGNWSRIRNLGLPVILVLQGDKPRFLVMQGFSGEGLLVGSSENLATVSREAIEKHWLGEYLVTWPQAPDWPAQIRRGQSGRAVEIVMEMAGFANPAWTGEGVFESEFESWLMTFQRRNGLRADGIIGPNTLIYLMAPTITQPRLMMDVEERS
jgi:general secretion pathway protein A